MGHIKSAAFIIIMCALSFSVSAQEFKKEVKTSYLKTCLEQADKDYDEYEMRLYRWWCECSSEKVSQQLTLTDFLKMKLMSKEESAKKMKAVIQVCTDTFKRNMTIYKEIKTNRNK
ncbi:MAG TPA: hypothetical protein VL093_06230 [Flavipsychrobacter sp.]|nr:hypothetical protein [Flavipsychrobacter sp.]